MIESVRIELIVGESERAQLFLPLRASPLLTRYYNGFKPGIMAEP